MLSRLRHRSYGVNWLFALLIVLKVTVGVLCIADDYQSVSAIASGVASSTPYESSRSESIASATFSEAFDPACWHAGADGCHCNCLHATATVSSNDTPWPMDRSWHRFAPMNSAIASLSPKNLLRPPIA